MGAAAALLLGGNNGAASRTTPLTLASDKTSLGHTEPAAGVTGVLHAIKAMQLGRFDPMLHLRSVNPHLVGSLAPRAFASMSMPRQPAGSGARHAAFGVSSFAFQGTNAHAIVRSPGADPAAWSTSSPAAVWLKQYMYVVPPFVSMVHGVSAASGTTVAFDIQLSHPVVAFLMDHVVNGKAVLPAAAYLESSFAAAQTALGLSASSTGISISGMALMQPLVVSVGEQASAPNLTIALNNATGACNIQSASGSASNAVTKHTEAYVSAVVENRAAAAPDTGIAASTDSIRARNNAPLATVKLYSDLSKAGLQYGPAFRLLRDIHTSAGAASARVQDCSDHGRYMLHPAALDNAFQLGAAVSDSSAAAGQTYIPATVDIMYSGSTGLSLNDLTAAASVAGPAKGSKAGASSIRRDIKLVSSSAGGCIVQGLESRAMGAAARQARAAADAEDIRSTYEVQWFVDSDASETVSPDCMPAASISLAKDELGAVAAGMQVLQQLPGQSSPSLALQFSTGSAPISVPQGQYGVRQLAKHGVWGMLRSAAQELQATTVSALHSASVTTTTASHAPRLLASEVPAPGAMFDGYGTANAASATLVPRLLPSLVEPAPQPCQMVPMPRGSLASLVPHAVDTTHCPEGSVVLNVKACALNFRDILNVSLGPFTRLALFLCKSCDVSS